MNRDEQASDEERSEDLAQAAGEPLSDGPRDLRSFYDLALRITLDAALATASVRAALAHAGEQTATRPGQLSEHAWLLGLVRDETLERLRVRGRSNQGQRDDAPAPLTASAPEFSALAANSAGAPTDPEAAGWAWQAARAQRPRDYSLLDLAVRRGLTPEEISDVASMSRSGSYTVLGRLRGAFEDSFATSVLFYRGREACPELDAIAVAATGLGPALRRDIGRHAEGCVRCRETRRGQPSPADIFAAFVEMEPPAALLNAFEAPAESEVVAAAEPVQPSLPIAALADPNDAETVALETTAEASVEPMAPEDAAPVGPDEAADEGERPPVEPSRVEAELDATTSEAETTSDVEMGAGQEEAAASAANEAAPEAVDAVPSEGKSPPEGESDVRGVSGNQGPVPEAGTDDAAAGEETAALPGGSRETPPFLLRRAASAGAPTRTTTIRPPRRSEAKPFRLRQEGWFGGGGPPSRLWRRFSDWFGEQGPARLSLIALVVVATALAVYLAVALGKSIDGGDGGGSVSGLAALPTQPATGIREIACGEPIVVTRPSSTTVTLDLKGILAGFQITEVKIEGVSDQAAPQSINASFQPGLVLVIDAFNVQSATARVDEYNLRILFVQGSDRAQSVCTLRVQVPALAPTATPAPTVAAKNTPGISTPTRTPTATPTRTQTPPP